MLTLNSLKSNLFHINEKNFEQHAIDTFHFQYNNNKIYRSYVEYLGIEPDEVTVSTKIPFLPIQFFKNHKVMSGDFDEKHVFHSSGTTGSTSKHYIEDLVFYKNNSSEIFTRFFGKLEGSVVIGLLPSYLERSNSSLVFMVDHFIKLSGNSASGFYLNNFDELAERIHSIDNSDIRIHLFGVTFALLEFASAYSLSLKNVNIFETGGMKGRGKEIIRTELHQKLKFAFSTENIFSEYGMTELLSQAYMNNKGFFQTPPWMKVQIRETHDPFVQAPNGKSGVICVIDLANIHSCSFIETQDLGIKHDAGFQVLGRMDNSELRGCNLILS